MRVQRGETERIVICVGVSRERRSKRKVDGFARTPHAIPMHDLIEKSLIKLNLDLDESHVPPLPGY